MPFASLTAELLHAVGPGVKEEQIVVPLKRWHLLPGHIGHSDS